MANQSYANGAVTVTTAATKVCTVPAENDDILVYCSAATVFGGPNLAAVNTNDVQTIGVGAATAGTFPLSVTLGGSTQTASGIAFNALASAVQTALQGLSNVGSGNVTVTGTAPTWVATFGSALANKNVPTMATSSASLTGGTATVTHTTPGGAGGVTVPATTLTHIPSAGDMVRDLYAIVATSTSTVSYFYPAM